MKLKMELAENKMQKTTPMSGGWYMVEPISLPIAELAYDRLDEDELDELAVAEVTKASFVASCLDADHSCAVFAGGTLVFVACANWVTVGDKRMRLWDTMSTRDVRECGLSRAFVKHTQEMIDTFISNEPTTHVVGICKSDFLRSMKWIERVAKWRRVHDIQINGVRHTLFAYKKEND